jgi:transposase-like protein
MTTSETLVAAKSAPTSTEPSEQPAPKARRPKTGGRVSKKTKETLALVAQAIDAGGTIRDAARAGGITAKTLYEWMGEDEQVKEIIEAAKLQRRQRLLERIETASTQSWQAAAWILERTMPEEFSKNATVHLTSDLNQPILSLQKVEINADPTRIAEVLQRLALSGALPVTGAAAIIGASDDTEDEPLLDPGANSSTDGVPAA